MTISPSHLNKHRLVFVCLMFTCFMQPATAIKTIKAEKAKKTVVQHGNPQPVIASAMCDDDMPSGLGHTLVASKDPHEGHIKYCDNFTKVTATVKNGVITFSAHLFYHSYESYYTPGTSAYQSTCITRDGRTLYGCRKATVTATTTCPDGKTHCQVRNIKVADEHDGSAYVIENAPIWFSAIAE